jgi:4-amino-4-deoxy-L-arabinose transferase-like glycosyltransferase
MGAMIINKKTSSLSMSVWKIATFFAALVFFAFSVRWSYLDTSPPAWDQGLYLFQATQLHQNLVHGNIVDFAKLVFNLDRGRVPLMLLIVQPAFLLFGPTLDAAVITLNFAWFILAWSVYGIAREVCDPAYGDKAGFFAFLLFALHPITGMLSSNFLVEFLLTGFVCAAMYSLLMMHRTRQTNWSMLTGLFVSLGLLTKVTFPAFLLPAVLIFVVQNARNTSIRSTCRLFAPVALLPILIAGPYYFHNFKDIIQLTSVLSSSAIAQLYNFGGVFDIAGIIGFLFCLFANSITIIAIPILIVLWAINKVGGNSASSAGYKREEYKTLLFVMAIWFALTFLLTMFGQVKESRYAYPGIIPIFILGGAAAARNLMRPLTSLATGLLCLIAVPGFLYRNDLMNDESVVAVVDRNFAATARPDSRNWRIDDIVQEVAADVDARQESKTIVFLGGNRYYHLRLLDYYGLIHGARLSYITLPYYENTRMTVEEAVKWISDAAPTAILYKSGENWPPFSSRLDAAIIKKLAADPRYRLKRLNTAQPDGSRFSLFLAIPPAYKGINSVSELLGTWKVAGGRGKIAVDDAGGLNITSESGAEASAAIRDGEIAVAAWKVSGRITSDLKQIHWNNGSVWSRIDADESH